MEELSQIWSQWILPVFSGISIAGILSAVIYACLRVGFSKAIGKIDVDRAEKKAVESGIEKIKAVTFTHDIQPIVESKMQTVEEKALAGIKSQLKTHQEQYAQLINVMASLAAYFDNSVGVSAECKLNLKSAITAAQSMAETSLKPPESKFMTEDVKPLKTQAKPLGIER